VRPSPSVSARTQIGPRMLDGLGVRAAVTPLSPDRMQAATFSVRVTSPRGAHRRGRCADPGALVPAVGEAGGSQPYRGRATAGGRPGHPACRVPHRPAAVCVRGAAGPWTEADIHGRFVEARYPHWCSLCGAWLLRDYQKAQIANQEASIVAASRQMFQRSNFRPSWVITPEPFGCFNWSGERRAVCASMLNPNQGAGHELGSHRRQLEAIHPRRRMRRPARSWYDGRGENVHHGNVAARIRAPNI
jgi:hypothetical protein